MKERRENNCQSLWVEFSEKEAETISGGHGNRSRSGGINSFVKNTIVIFQTNIVNIIGNISGNLTINQGNSSGINQGNRGKR
jgi:hypothetical protein